MEVVIETFIQNKDSLNFTTKLILSSTYFTPQHPLCTRSFLATSPDGASYALRYISKALP